MQRLVADDELRERMGAAARARARGVHVGAHRARDASTLLEATARARAGAAARGRSARSETLKAVGMAAATMANNALALVFTVLFARMLGAEDYGSLAALVSTFVILAVPGSAVQVAVAREIALGPARRGSAAGGDAVGLAKTAAADRASWSPPCAVLLREPIADLISVPEAWAAAAAAPDRRAVAAAVGRARRAAGRAPVQAGGVVDRARGRRAAGVRAGPGGARAGRDRRLPRARRCRWPRPRSGSGGSRARGSARRRRAPAARRLRDLVGGAWPAVVGLFLVALLQNVDVILVKRQIGGDAAGAYAAAAVAAKAVVWVAIGIGLYLLPEATRAARHGAGPAAGAGARAGASWRRSRCRC